MLTRTGTRAVIASLVVTMLAGCASSKKAATQFWPPPPNAPRIQYLKKVSGSIDVVGKQSISLIDVGDEKPKVVPLIKPFGLAVSKGTLYICDTVQSQVVLYNLPAKTASVLKGNKGPGQLKKPINVAVDEDGYIFVADSGRKQVLKYAPDGSFERTVDEEGMKPVGVAVDDLYLYILNSSKGLVQLYDRKTLTPLRSFGQEGDERGRLFNPLGIGLDKKGGVYVSNLDGRLIHFDRDGHSLRVFGKLGTALSEFNRPRAIAFDKDGVMYVVDAASQNVRLMNEGFQLLMSFGEPGTQGSLNVPAGIAVTEDDLAYYQQFTEKDFTLERVIFVVSQFGENKVSIYGLGKKQGIDYEAQLRERQEDIRKREEAIAREAAAKEAREKEKEKQQAASAQGNGDAATPAADAKK